MFKGISYLLKLLNENNGKNCDMAGHEFFCADVKGTRNEILLFRKALTTQELQRLENGNTTREEVCPGGRIICKRCRREYPATMTDLAREPLPKVVVPDFLKE